MVASTHHDFHDRKEVTHYFSSLEDEMEASIPIFVFLPYNMLQREIEMAIYDELKQLVNKCLTQSKKVKSREWFLSRAKENEIECTVDNLLTRTCPYNEGRGWTSLTTRIARIEGLVEVTLKPLYVPFSDVSQSLVVSSVKPLAANDWCGEVFGQYNFQGVRNGYPYYKQRHTVDNNTKVCQIYKPRIQTNSRLSTQKRVWYMRIDDTKDDYYLYHENSTVSVPRSGWTKVQPEHGDSYASYYDPTEFQSLVSVALGALDCGTVTISGVEKFPQCNGDYRPTGQYSRGLMVFKHSTSRLFLCCVVGAHDWRGMDWMNYPDAQYSNLKTKPVK